MEGASRAAPRRRHARWATESMRQALRDVHTGCRNITAAARHHGIPRQTLVDYYKESLAAGEQATILKRRGVRLAAADSGPSRRRQPPGPAASPPDREQGEEEEGSVREERAQLQRCVQLTLQRLQVTAEQALFAVGEVTLRTCGHRRAGRQLNGDAAAAAAEEDETASVVACVSAGGRCLPPAVVFKEDAVPGELSEDNTSDFHVFTSKSGLVTESVFAAWMAHFVLQKPAGPVLLLVSDERYLSEREGAALRLAEQHEVALQLLPSGPGLARRLHPLQRRLLPRLAARYTDEAAAWHASREQPERGCPLQACFQHILSTAWHQSLGDPQQVTEAFRSCGLADGPAPAPAPATTSSGSSSPSPAAAAAPQPSELMAQLLRAVGRRWPAHLPPSLPIWLPGPLR